MTAPTITKKSKKAATKTITTHILAIIDQSGSMAGKEEAVRTGLKEIVASAKSDVVKGGSKVTFSLIRLDGVVLPFDYLLAGAETVETLPEYVPGSMTPLYDAIGTGVVTLEKEDKDGEDISFLVYILTDGMENASRVYNAEMVQSNIKRLEAKGNWTFIWSITKTDFNAAAAALNFNTNNMHAYDNTSEGTFATAATTSGGIKSFLSARRAGATNSDSFYTEHIEPSTTTSGTDATVQISTSTGTAQPPSSWVNTTNSSQKPKKDNPGDNSVVSPPKHWLSS